MDDGAIRGNTEAREFLTPDELAARWGMTRHGLAHNRKRGNGPRFLQVGERGRILYPLDEVLAFEEARLRSSTARDPRPDPAVEPELPLGGPREPELPLGGPRHGS